LDRIPSAPSDLKKQSSSDSTATAAGKEKKSKKKKGGKGGEDLAAAPPVVETITPPVTEEPVKQSKKKSKKIASSEPETETAPLVTPAPIETPAPPAATAPPANYIASKTFAGAKPGYVFKKVSAISAVSPLSFSDRLLFALFKGPKGIGYYKDAFAKVPKTARASEATPVRGGGKQEKKRKIEEVTLSLPLLSSHHSVQADTSSEHEQVKAKKTKAKESRVRFGKNQSKGAESY
jgi:hypothetical protein